MRYRSFIYHQMEQPYKLSPDRDGFLSLMKADLIERLSPVLSDSFLSEIVKIWQRGFHLRQSLTDVLQKIEKVRRKYFEIYDASFDAKEIFHLEEIDPLVIEEDPREIVKFLVRHGVENYFFSVVQALETARQRGGLREREEMAILSRVERGEKMTPTSSGSEIGFRWAGIKVQQRMEELYDFLKQKGFILRQTTREQFKEVFSDKPVETRVTWLKTSKQLLLFVEAFLDKELIYIPPNLEKKRKRIRELSVIKARGKNTPAQDGELRGLLHEVNHWLYSRIGAGFKNKKGISFTSKALKHTRNDVFNKLKLPKMSAEFENLAYQIASI